ncbi:hypothetical protein [Leptolyngbya iicbica]|uniref:Uncharacterized protein n=2 Tax=Cyanophyceae TaxID=3028117 RepID=A0A4Q7EA23_9CYAN|nr:hypothetical protein [Leptolyngbya sp. LK]RZM79737.1 hypothetical protein DYY88_13675 [Leptolyngbya sp. LK]
MNRRSLGWIGVAAIALIAALMFGTGQVWLRPALSIEPPLLAQTTPEETVSADGAAPALSGTYEDPQGNFQIGLLEGVTTTTAGGSPLFTLPDGSLSYSVVQLPLESEAPLPEVTLVALANQALNNGEGFQTQTFTAVPRGLQIEWTGRLSQRGAPQPVSGSILANQQGATVYLLVVAALEDATAQVPQTLVTLADSLEFL